MCLCVYIYIYIKPTRTSPLAQVADLHGVERADVGMVDTGALGEAYQLLLGMRSREVVEALMNATESLLCKLQVINRHRQPCIDEQALVCLSNRDTVDASRGRFIAKWRITDFFSMCFGLIYVEPFSFLQL